MFGLDTAQMFVLSTMFIPLAMLMLVFVSSAFYRSYELVKQRLSNDIPGQRKTR